jgi:hypothetical protein
VVCGSRGHGVCRLGCFFAVVYIEKRGENMTEKKKDLIADLRKLLRFVRKSLYYYFHGIAVLCFWVGSVHEWLGERVRLK